MNVINLLPGIIVVLIIMIIFLFKYIIHVKKLAKKTYLMFLTGFIVRINQGLEEEMGLDFLLQRSLFLNIMELFQLKVYKINELLLK
ncbi:hypothetical protein CLORY_05070 [Clostridium oryzae]|uniref:Uncharacterized protein n=1 Tax=Clostridium oryzae TaxID=1450648 RepID=A0A1V4IX60_9CLOT|nr:hypothetical protein CLORY_05070 [Clostridium oryzae]